MVAGAFLGLLVGIISGTVALVLLRTANSRPAADLTTVVTITTEILAIPTFWFGGPWVTTSLMSFVALEELINPYIIVLAITFVAIVCYPIMKWIIKLGDEFGRAS